MSGKENEHKQQNPELANQGQTLIETKRENFRETMRRTRLDQIFSENRERSRTPVRPTQRPRQTMEIEQQVLNYMKLCNVHKNDEDCKYHDIYTTLQIVSYGAIDEFVLRRQVEYQMLLHNSKQRRNNDFAFLFHTANLTKNQLIIKKGKKTFITEKHIGKQQGSFKRMDSMLQIVNTSRRHK